MFVVYAESEKMEEAEAILRKAPKKYAETDTFEEIQEKKEMDMEMKKKDYGFSSNNDFWKKKEIAA